MKSFLRDVVTVITIGLLMATSYYIGSEKESFLPSGTGSVSHDTGPVLKLYHVSAYCPCKICCGRWADGYTASGKPAVGLIVAAPPNILFGTVLIIPGYGVAAVQDRGAAITGNRLDVLFAAHEEAKQWGVQELIVKEIR